MVAFLYSKWLSLSLVTRQAIAKELGIAKTGSTHVVDNRVQSDGYDIKTVEEALERNEEDWDWIVAKAEGRGGMPSISGTPAGSFVGGVPQGMENAQILSPQIPIEEVILSGGGYIDKDTGELTAGAVVVEESKKKTTRAKPARRKGK